MAVPGFQELMLPMLRIAVDGKPRQLAEYRTLLAEQLELTEADLAEMLPSGTQKVFVNRVAWSSVYLQRAKLLQRPERGVYKITDRGLEELDSPPPVLTISYLMKYPELKEFRTKKKTKNDASPMQETGLTPEESLENAYQTLQEELGQELLEQLTSCSPQFFEKLVVELVVELGYGGSIRDAGQAVRKGADEGIDGTIKEDRLGLGVIYLQAKKWENVVGRPEIQKFVGALHGKHARKGIFITTSHFSKEARDYVLNIDPQVVLIDGEQLAQLMIDTNLGVSPHAAYELKRIDTDYFVE